MLILRLWFSILFPKTHLYLNVTSGVSPEQKIRLKWKNIIHNSACLKDLGLSFCVTGLGFKFQGSTLKVRVTGKGLSGQDLG